MKSYVIILSLILVFLSAAGCESGAMLGPKWSAGEKYSQKVHMVSDLSMALAIPNIDHKESDMVLNYEVREAGKDGSAVVAVTIASIKVSVISLSIQCQYDSEAAEGDASSGEVKDGGAAGANPEETPAMARREAKKQKHQQQYAEAFSDLKGKSYVAKIDATGKVASLEITDAKLLQIADLQLRGVLATDQQMQLLSRDRLREYAAAAVQEYAGVKGKFVKGKWDGQIVIEAPRANSRDAEAEYTFNGIETEAGVSVAKVGIKATKLVEAAKDKAGASMQQGFVIVGGSVEGTAKIRVSDRKLVRQDETVKVEVQTNMGSAGVAADQKKSSVYTIQRTIERVEGK